VEASAAEPVIDEPLIDHGNDVFGVELRGFDHIPEAERNMTLRQVGPMWLGANLNMFSISVGCVSITLGLSLWQALAACVIGNLPYVYLGLASVGAVRAGLPATTLSRAAYGVRGNGAHALLTWAASVCFEVFNGVFGVLAWLSLLGLLGFDKDGSGEKIAAVIIQLALGGGIAVLGQATMVFLQKIFAVVLGVVLLAVLVWSAHEVNWARAASAHASLTNFAVLAAFMSACGVIASQPISYVYNGPDWVRYLPSETPAKAIFNHVFWWTFIPCIALTAMGAMWASLGDMSDPVAGLKPIIPGWLYIVFILAVIAGSVANNAPTFYSSGLALQSLGLKLSRWSATLLDIGVSTAAVLYILFVHDLSTVLNDFVSLLVAWSGPYAGVWLCDGILRLWRFDMAEIHPGKHPAPRHNARILRSWLAYFAGMGAAVLTMKSPLFEGPVARALGGMDLSWVLGLTVSAAAYALLSRLAAAPVEPAGAAGRGLKGQG
jgi:NCS1 family nucleobase:cation symporter-1